MKTTPNQRLRALREALNMTVTEFAVELNVSASQIQKVESNQIEPSEKLLKTTCTTFSVPTEWLIDNIGQMKFAKPTKTPTNVNPYQDILYKELKDQIEFLKETIRALTTRNANFRKALDGTGLLKSKSLRAAA